MALAIDPISGSARVGAATQPLEPGSMRVPAKLLGQNDFLKLVVAQMANQDPLKPMSDTEFVAQMTQFTALEQAKAMQGDIAEMRSQQKILQAMSMLDREVVVQSEKSGTVTGVIRGFDLEGKEPKLIIGDERFDLTDILTIRLAPLSAPGGAASNKLNGLISTAPTALEAAAAGLHPDPVTQVAPGSDEKRSNSGGV